MFQLITTPGQVGDIFRGRRKARQLSQQELAVVLGVGQSRLSTLESKPEAMTLERFLVLANVLGFEVVLRDKAQETARPPAAKRAKAGAKLEW